jgi:uncharacterized protein YbjT (DUF2867 family)
MTILVTGATAGVGRQVVSALLDAGATDVRAMTNNPARAALPTGINVVEGFLGRPETLPAAFDGIEKMYLAPYPPTVDLAVATARAAGVRHIVDLAGPPGSSLYSVQEAVEASGVAWTHLQPGEFMENATDWAEQIRSTGVVRDGYPQSANAPIAVADVAAVAAAALLQDGHRGRVHELTGPQTLSRAEMVRLIGVALGRDIAYLELDHEQAVDALTPTKGEYARWYVEGMALLAEFPQPATDTLAQLLDRQPVTFAEWAVGNADLFR